MSQIRVTGIARIGSDGSQAVEGDDGMYYQLTTAIGLEGRDGDRVDVILQRPAALNDAPIFLWSIVHQELEAV